LIDRDNLQKLLDEWFEYRNMIFNVKIGHIAAIELRLERDGIDALADTLHIQMLKDDISEDDVNRFATDIGNFRKEMTIDILKSGDNGQPN
jgi:hypothetical protein